MHIVEKNMLFIALFVVAFAATFVLQARQTAGGSGQGIWLSTSTTMGSGHASRRFYATHDRCCPAHGELLNGLNKKEWVIGKTDKVKNSGGHKNSIASNRVIVPAKVSTGSERWLVEQSRGHR